MSGAQAPPPDFAPEPSLAGPQDRDAVVALWEACGLTRPWNDLHKDFDFAVAGPSSAVILLRAAGEIVACAMVGHDGHRGGLYYLAVAPEKRGQGLGRRMMAQAEGWLRGQGVPKLNLMVRSENAAVIGFYRALGYADTDCASLGKRLD